MKITRGELGNILSGNMQTRTLCNRRDQHDMELTDNWTVVSIETDENGILNIYCEAPTNN